MKGSLGRQVRILPRVVGRALRKYRERERRHTCGEEERMRRNASADALASHVGISALPLEFGKSS